MAWAAALGLAALVSAGPAGASAQQFPGDVRAVDAALGRLPAKTVVLDDFPISGWLLWRHPDLTPVLDLRVEIYSSDQIATYRRAERVGPGWLDIIQDTGARHALLRTDSALALALRERAAWTPLASTRDYVLLAAPTS